MMLDHISLFIFLMICVAPSFAVQGGIALALAGKESVTIAVDSRMSSPGTGNLFLGNKPRGVYRIGSHTLVACVGMYSVYSPLKLHLLSYHIILSLNLWLVLIGLDVHALKLMNDLRQKLHLEVEEDLEPENVCRLVSDLMYTSQYLCTPVNAGVSSDGKPYLCSMDGLGAQTISSTFVATGSSISTLLASCEDMYVPNQNPVSLLEMSRRIIKKSLQRDVLSGSQIYSFTMSKGSIYRKLMALPDV